MTTQSTIQKALTPTQSARSRKTEDVLELPVILSLKFLTLPGNVAPQAAMPTYRAGTANLESDNVLVAGDRRREVDVGTRYIRCTAIGQWEYVDILLLRRHGHDGSERLDGEWL